MTWPHARDTWAAPGGNGQRSGPEPGLWSTSQVEADVPPRTTVQKGLALPCHRGRRVSWRRRPLSQLSVSGAAVVRGPSQVIFRKSLLTLADGTRSQHRGGESTELGPGGPDVGLVPWALWGVSSGVTGADSPHPPIWAHGPCTTRALQSCRPSRVGSWPPGGQAPGSQHNRAHLPCSPPPARSWPWAVWESCVGQVAWQVSCSRNIPELAVWSPQCSVTQHSFCLAFAR